MNILYLAHRIPYPPNKGDKIRSFRQLEYLAKHHRVWCACFVDRSDDLRHVETLREHCADVVAIRLRRIPALCRALSGLVRGATVTESFYRSREMTRALDRWIDSTRFDAVVAFSSSMATLALGVPARRRVLDCCDLDSRKWQDYAGSRRGLLQRLYHTEGMRLARREVQWLDSFDATIVITEHEAEPLLNATGSHRLHVVRNGVTLEEETVDTAYRTVTAPVVGFIGAMDYRPNVDAVVWFVKHCWPGVRAAVPDAVFRIVGRSPVRVVRRLAR
ncbi:MAG: sugar transferase, partial [Planctomycetes bacterium]|nr:sugar transferase [Planctomycetota bacterium]